MGPASSSSDSFSVRRFRERRQRRVTRERQLRRRHVVLESLEDRQLLATLPAPLVINESLNVGAKRIDLSPGNDDSESTPSVTVNPANPNQLVAVWTQFDDTPDTDVSSGRGAYSTDGGATWTTFDPSTSFILDPTTSNPTIPFIRESDPTVAFDRSGNFMLRNAGTTWPTTRAW